MATTGQSLISALLMFSLPAFALLGYFRRFWIPEGMKDFLFGRPKQTDDSDW